MRPHRTAKDSSGPRTRWLLLGMLTAIALYWTIARPISFRQFEHALVRRHPETRTLSNGVHIPIVGFGTAGLARPRESIRFAVDSGYRLLDTASDTGPWYRTESVIGDLLESARGDVFVTSKVHPQDLGTTSTAQSVNQTLANLRASSVDLLLIHYPRCWGDLCSKTPEGTWKDAWRIMEAEYRKGRIRALGVSNFDTGELEELLIFAVVKPHVVQSYFDPLRPNWPLVEFCRRHAIAFQAYSALGSQHRNGGGSNPVLSDPTVKKVAQRHSKTAAQVVLYLVQNGMLVLPRSESKAHIEQNMDIWGFTLTEEDLLSIRALAA